LFEKPIILSLEPQTGSNRIRTIIAENKWIEKNSFVDDAFINVGRRHKPVSGLYLPPGLFITDIRGGA